MMVHDYGLDRTCRIHAIDRRTGTSHVGPDGKQTGIHGWWRVDNGSLEFDWDHDSPQGVITRIRRMLPASFPGALRPLQKDGCPIERLSAGELIFRNQTGKVIRLTRDPAD
jgi:hypothetical protein